MLFWVSLTAHELHEVHIPELRLVALLHPSHVYPPPVTMSMPEQMDLETSDVELDVAEQVAEEGEASADEGRVPGPGGVARVFPGGLQIISE